MEVDIGNRIGFWGMQMKEINEKIGEKNTFTIYTWKIHIGKIHF